MFAHAKRGRGLGAKNRKPSISHLVSAVPHPMTKGGNGERWWECVDKEGVVGSRFIHTHEVGEGSWG